MGTAAPRLAFVKGHGTGNDFVLLPDRDRTLALDEALVRAICDRRTGIGADGVLRVARDGDVWFMDYRNADGSVAQTCGNGIRVFARYLVESGLAAAGDLVVGTRAGRRRVQVPAGGGDITVEMGSPEWLPDAAVSVAGDRYDAVGVSMGNPHLVALGVAGLDGLDLTAPPAVDPATAYPEGVNVEFVQPEGPAAIRMRVHERGVGETRSCGSGAAAAAVAAMRAVGERGTWRVDVPGGRLRVTWEASGAVTLTGPAVLVAWGDLDPVALLAAVPAGK